MKRWLKYAVIAVFLIGMAAGAGALSWLLGTTDGARWLLAAVSSHTSYRISARRVEGRIWNDLRLEGARIQWPHGGAGIGGVRLRWQAFFLLVGKVSISELQVKDARIRDDRAVSKALPDLGWPRVSGIPAWLNMRIRKLQIDGLEYRRHGEAPINVTKISARVMWQGNVLTVRDFVLTAPSLHADGALMAGFRNPALLLKLHAGVARPVGGMDGLSCEARLFSARDPEQVAGPVKINGLSGGKPFLEIAADIGVTRNSVNVRKLRLDQPGRRGTMNGEGTFALTGEKPSLHLQMGFSDLDLSRELLTATSLTGALSLDGNLDGYRGKFKIANKVAGWRAGRVSGAFLGDGRGVKLTALEGLVLDGTVTGDARADWREGVAVRGSLRGRNLNPAKVTPEWKGVVNLDLSGSAAWVGTKPMRAELTGRLLESRLRGKALTGGADVSVAGDNLLFRRMELHGKGFDVRAKGELRNQLAFSAQVGDLSGLVPKTAGKLNASGWVRWRDKRLSGSVSGGVRNLSAAGIRINSSDLSVHLAEGRGYPLRIDAKARGVAYGQLRLDSAAMSAAGRVESHTIEAALRASDFQASATLSGGYRKGVWQGVISRFSGSDAVGPWSMDAATALRVSADSVSLSHLSLSGEAGEHLEADGQVTLHPLRGFIRSEWRSLNLVRISRWTGATGFSGHSSGAVQVSWPGQNRLLVTGRADASGAVTVNGQRVLVRQASAQMDWTEQGMLSRFDLRLADGGMLKGSFSSPQPAGLGPPSQGSFEADLQKFNVALLHPWLPAGLDLSGLATGQAKGNFLPGNHLDARGNVSLSRGEVSWKNDSGRFNAKLNMAEASWAWQGDSFTGTTSLVLEEYGQARAGFRIPLPARLPAAINPAGPLMVNVTGTAMETGLLTSLFPGLIRESRGELNFDVRVGGQWQYPDITGKLKLARASAYLSTAGVQLKNVEMTSHFAHDQLIVDTFNVESGPGRIGGKAVIRLKDWRVAGYEGTIKGDRFQVVYLPDLQALANPDLSFAGSPGKLSVRGQIIVPELLVNEQQSRAPIQPSEDVVIEGEAVPVQKKAGEPLDIQVTVTLGDKVQLKLQGIEAQLKGSLKLVIHRWDEIRSTGEIRVVKGSYKTYGITLDITRGRVYYAGGTIDQPMLDIQALRKVGDVRAGVTIVGTPRTMTVKLYSKPNMPDSAILSYIILGQPLAYTSEQSGLVTRASGQLLSTSSGYRPIQATPPGIAPSKTAGSTLSQSVVSVGRYLTPQLYISYGRSILTGANLIRMRYDLSRRWELESQTGTESGGDVFFKINFK